VPEIPRSAVVGEWTHSHEEDTAQERVYRRSSHPFPRARGRESFEIRPDGTLVDRSSGPADRALESEGSWELREDGTLVLHSGRGRTERRLEVISADDDRLVVRRR
jgi:hypothetical protein